MAKNASRWNWPRSTGGIGSITGHGPPAEAAAAYSATNRAGRRGLNQPKQPPRKSERFRLRINFGTVLEIIDCGCKMKSILDFVMDLALNAQRAASTLTLRNTASAGSRQSCSRGWRGRECVFHPFAGCVSRRTRHTQQQRLDDPTSAVQ